MKNQLLFVIDIDDDKEIVENVVKFRILMYKKWRNENADILALLQNKKNFPNNAIRWQKIK